MIASLPPSRWRGRLEGDSCPSIKGRQPGGDAWGAATESLVGKAGVGLGWGRQRTAWEPRQAGRCVPQCYSGSRSRGSYVGGRAGALLQCPDRKTRSNFCLKTATVLPRSLNSIFYL